MTCILPGITTLEQHVTQLQIHPESYRPERCPHCGRSGLWCHGGYGRKADRGSGELNPVFIPRFQCPHCTRTCSVLPQCLPPRRWHLWAVQAAVLLGLLAGQSLRRLSRTVAPGRHTIRRWMARWRACFPLHAFHLRNRFPALGRHPDMEALWPATLALLPLGGAMHLLHQAGVAIP
jgi:transposase-like protein